MVYGALTIAKWFIAWAESEEADLSNLKLQKLLYYAQGHHLAMHDTPLFSDNIQAWIHGPVVPDVYREYKRYESADVHLDSNDDFQWVQVDPQTTDLLIKTWNTYGGYAAWTLRNMTHNEAPWADVFDFNTRGAVIEVESMRTYFKSRLSGTSH
ncbi:Panacea domain-containing protein [Jatrophihabitans sp. DSM 45814]